MAGHSKSAPPRSKAVTFREYAAAQVLSRLNRVAFELRHSRRKPDDENIHRLRVAIRRLTETLRVFVAAFPEKEARKVRRQLRKIMKAAGAVREVDIAIGLAAAAGIPENAALFTALRYERERAARLLEESVRRAYRRNVTSRWREELLLTA
jgi:CHAD domain-containing protein